MKEDTCCLSVVANSAFFFVLHWVKDVSSQNTASIKGKTAAVSTHNENYDGDKHYEGGAECEINRPEHPTLIDIPSSLPNCTHTHTKPHLV